MPEKTEKIATFEAEIHDYRGKFPFFYQQVASGDHEKLGKMRIGQSLADGSIYIFLEREAEESYILPMEPLLKSALNALAEAIE